MRAKLVHGTNSMTWANKVLPTYMRAPWGSQPKESTRFLPNKVQVGTKLNRPAARDNAGSRARHGSFNRTWLGFLVAAGTASRVPRVPGPTFPAPLAALPPLFPSPPPAAAAIRPGTDG